MGGISIFMRRRGIQSSPTESNYIRFEDKQVEQICVANFSSDGIGLTPEDAAAVTNIGLIFRGNTTIESFDEFKYFTSVSYIGTGADASSGGAFAGCTSLKKITLPESLTDIRPFAFYGCTSLESINLENEHITKIGNEAFKSCGKLHVNIDLPNLELLGSRVSADVFQYSGITSVTSLGRITRIWGYTPSEHGTFLGCSNLKRAVLPQTLTIIGGRAFQNCTQLSELNIPISVTTIEGHALSNCTSLIYDEFKTPNLTTLVSTSLTNVIIKKWLNMGNITALTLGGINKTALEELIVPNTISSLPNSIFNGYTSLVELHITWDNIKEVGSSAIANVPALTNKELILSNVTKIGVYAFNSSLVKSIDLTDCNVVEISRIFETCPNLITIKLPKVTTSIGAYMMRASLKVETLIVPTNIPPTLHASAFEQASSIYTIYVPDESVESYKEATNWSRVASRIKPLSEYSE